MKTAFNYDAIADAYAAGVDSAPYNALYERPAMVEMLPPIENAAVLDAGCAAGWSWAFRGHKIPAAGRS